MELEGKAASRKKEVEKQLGLFADSSVLGPCCQ